MNINERFKRIRKTLKITQSEFGDKIGLKQSTITQIEHGKSIVTDRTISSLRQAFNVNEKWLRDGGDDDQMFIEISDTQLMDIANEYGLDELSKSFLLVYFKMDAKKRKNLLETLTEMILEMKSSTQKEKVPPPYKWEDFDVDEETERYRQKLLEEKRQREASSALPEQRNA